MKYDQWHDDVTSRSSTLWLQTGRHMREVLLRRAETTFHSQTDPFHRRPKKQERFLAEQMEDTSRAKKCQVWKIVTGRPRIIVCARLTKGRLAAKRVLISGTSNVWLQTSFLYPLRRHPNGHPTRFYLEKHLSINCYVTTDYFIFSPRRPGRIVDVESTSSS